MNFSAVLPTFVVTLREGFEAALVVGIVFACLKKAQQSNLNQWVTFAVIAGILASIMVGLLLGGILQTLSSSAPILEEFLQVIFGVLAIAMLSWMLIWMSLQAKNISTEISGAITTALKDNSRAAWGVFTLVFIAVLREGIETVLFIVAKFQSGVILPTIGAIIGLLTAALLGLLLFKWGVKINIRLFFQVMGVFLLLIIGGLVVGVLKHLDGAIASLTEINPEYAGLCITPGVSCLLGMQVWDISHILPDSQLPGVILKSLLGYRDHLYLLQGIFYLLFLTVIGGIYWRSLSEN
jgi:high-affinity iron transporter